MSVGYLPHKKFAGKALAKFKEEYGAVEGEKIFNGIFASRRDNIALNMALRLVRAHKIKYAQFKRLLHSCVQGRYSFTVEALLEKCPLMVLGKDPGSLLVYTNVIIDDTADEAFSNACWLMPGVVQSFEEAYKKDMEGPILRKKWATAARSWARIKRYEEMSIATVLRRNTNATKLGLSDTSIRDLAASIEEARKPMELLYAEKPEDFMEMYQEKGLTSCMSSKNAQAKYWDIYLFPHKHHPCSFYAYHPYTKGVYALHRDSIAARTILFLTEDNVWRYGRIYSANDALREKFITSLEAAGHLALEGAASRPGSDYRGGWFSRDCEFEIPALLEKNSGVSYAPIPYCDNLALPVFMVFDKKTKVFKVKCGKGLVKQANVSLSSVQGWVRSDQLVFRECDNCHELILSPKIPLLSNDGKAFCARGCMRLYGYVIALRDNGSSVIVPREGCVCDGNDPNAFYTNYAAAYKLGALPVIFDLNCECEDGNLTRYGTPILRNNEHYMMSNAEVLSEYIRSGCLEETDMKWRTGATVFRFVKNEVEGHFNLNIHTQRNVELDDDEPFIMAAELG